MTEKDKKKEYNKKYYEKKKMKEESQQVEKLEKQDMNVELVKKFEKNKIPYVIERESETDDDDEDTMTFAEIQKYIDQQVQKNLYLQQTTHPPPQQQMQTMIPQQQSTFSQVKTNITRQITQALVMASIPILAKCTQNYFLERPKQLTKPLNQQQTNTSNLEGIF